MKTLLILLLVSICAIGWRSESIMQAIGMARPAPQTIQSLTVPAGQQPPTGMSLTEYAELAKKDPDAYRKLFASHQQKEERSEVDKLMNLLSTGKYE
jgi:hypothetical protein